jgi:hypothetical protein
MTEAQIRYRQMREQERHDVEQEANWQAQLQETVRSNLAREDLSRYATEVSESNARLQAETSRYATDVNAETSRFGTVVGASTSRYATDTNASTSIYRTDVESSDRQKRLEFDQATQEFRQSMERAQLSLNQAETNSNIRLRAAQLQQIHANITNAYKDLELKAERLGMDQEASRINNKLHEAETELASMRTAKTATEVADKFVSWSKDLIKWLKL